MPVNSQTDLRLRLALTVFGIGSIAALIVVPTYFRSGASSQKKSGITTSKTLSAEPDLPNYDIREDKKAINKVAAFRGSMSKDEAQVANVRQQFVLGEKELAARVPNLKVEYNTDLKIPEVITRDVKQGKGFLTSASKGTRSDILLGFLRQNPNLIGVNSAQVDQLKVFADYSNPEGNMSFVEIDQEINGVPVFRGEVKAGFTQNGEMVRVINNLAPGLEYATLSTDFNDPSMSVNAAAGYINLDAAKIDLRPNPAETTDLKSVFGTGDWATTAEKMYFPTEPGIAIPAWRVLIWEPNRAYYVIVDAQTGAMLWRKNITQDQTQPATYSVYVNPNAMINAAHNPFPLIPAPLLPNGLQGASIGRTAVTRIGNEAPYTFNANGWINDGVTKTDGNAVQAGLDRDGTTQANDGIDLNSEAMSGTRNFTFAYSPLDPNTNVGDAPLPATQTYPGTVFQQGIDTQLFYYCNLYHDELYRLGFTEAARNFQANNFGRGGVGNDRVSAEGQDASGTNNANFSTPADGGRGKMQMYIFTTTAAVNDIDGSLDGDVVLHEHTHGLSNRLHGNGSGLATNMSGGMGEGWSDFYALSLLSTPTDPLNGINPAGAYATYLLQGIGTTNNYYGIRRFPYALISTTGPNGKPHNPETFNDVDSSKINLTDGAFAPKFTGTADEVHNMGEVWCSALWEVRGRFVTRLGWDVGNRKALQIITDGMKLAPLAPTFLSERDAIVAAAQAGAGPGQASADVADVWAGFAARGMGASATIQNIGTGLGDTRVTEAFDLPNLIQTPVFTVSDVTGNGNGFPESGEHLTLTLPLTNNTGITATGVTLQIVGGDSANYGTINNGSTVSQSVGFTVPAGTQCGSVLTLTFNVNSSIGPTSFTRTILIGVPTVILSQNFDGVTAPSIPAGWTATSVSGGLNFVTVTSSSDTPPNSAYAVDPVNGPAGEGDLTSPSIPISSTLAAVSFRHRYDSEAAWDGGVLDISISGGPFTDIISAGGAFISNGYNGTMTPATVSATYTPNPLNGRQGWTGNSGGFITSVVRLPPSASGHSVQLRWRFGADDNTAGNGPNPGWYVDTIQMFGSFTCSTFSKSKARADFDGDGKSDESVFRPSEGNWYAIRSGGGGVLFENWGIASDVLAPGDYDGDGVTDLAIFRPTDGRWWIIRSSDTTVETQQWGATGDIPVAGDYDGDGTTDMAIWRPSDGNWFIIESRDGVQSANWGVGTDKPVPGDYDGDGKTDIAVWRPSDGNWFVFGSRSGVAVTNWGVGTDRPVPADYDGDGKDDVAVFRPSDGNWFVIGSRDGLQVTNWGVASDITVPGDYDGDGKTDVAVFRPSDGNWFIIGTKSGLQIVKWGTTGDIPVPSKYIP